jgi:hypothetical protein
MSLPLARVLAQAPRRTRRQLVEERGQRRLRRSRCGARAATIMRGSLEDRAAHLLAPLDLLRDVALQERHLARGPPACVHSIRAASARRTKSATRRRERYARGATTRGSQSAARSRPRGRHRERGAVRPSNGAYPASGLAGACDVPRFSHGKPVKSQPRNHSKDHERRAEREARADRRREPRVAQPGPAGKSAR